MKRIRLLKNGEHVKFLARRLPATASHEAVLADCKKRLPAVDFDDWSVVDETSEQAKTADTLRQAAKVNEEYLKSDEALALAEFHASERNAFEARKNKFLKARASKT